MFIIYIKISVVFRVKIEKTFLNYSASGKLEVLGVQKNNIHM